MVSERRNFCPSLGVPYILGLLTVPGFPVPMLRAKGIAAPLGAMLVVFFVSLSTPTVDANHSDYHCTGETGLTQSGWASCDVKLDVCPADWSGTKCRYSVQLTAISKTGGTVEGHAPAYTVRCSSLTGDCSQTFNTYLSEGTGGNYWCYATGAGGVSIPNGYKVECTVSGPYASA